MNTKSKVWRPEKMLWKILTFKLVPRKIDTLESLAAIHFQQSKDQSLDATILHS